MPKTIPIRDLKNTTAVADMVRESGEPIYITRNGYDNMVIMSSEEYDRMKYLMDVYEKLALGEADIREGHVHDAFETIDMLIQKNKG